MVCSGDWKVSQAKKYKPDGKYGVAPFPGPDGPAPDASWAGGWSWVVPKGAQNLDAAWQSWRWTCGPEGQDMFNKATYHIPTNKKAAADPYYTRGPAAQGLHGPAAGLAHPPAHPGRQPAVGFAGRRPATRSSTAR